jgi:hypothetical protein
MLFKPPAIRKYTERNGLEAEVENVIARGL